MKKIGTLCFLCEKIIAEKGQDPVTLRATGSQPIMDGHWRERPSQTFFCHSKCLRARVVDLYCLHPAFGGKEFDFKKARALKREDFPLLKRGKS